MSLKDDILSAVDSDLEEVKVDEWNTTIYLKPLSGTARAKLIQDVKNNKDLDKVQLRVLINSICDAEGNLVFSEADIPKLGKKNSKVLSRLETMACNISGMSEEGQNDTAKN